MLNWNFLTAEIEQDALLLDCRSEEQFNQSTVKGAYCASFIKKPFGSGPQSMNKLSGFLKNIQNIQKKRKVIVFDEGEGMYACRMLWLLNGIDITDAKILALKFSEIPEEFLGPGAGVIECETITAPLNIKGIVSISHIQKNLTKLQIVDVRMPEENDGELPRMVNPEPGSICGRIPGSVNWDWRLLYGTNGHIKSRQELVSQIRKIGIIQERPTLLYDFNGARSCSTALVLTRCGYKQISVYLGSWMEWRKSDLPKQNVRKWPGH